jgi:hypothetical protein
MMTMLSKTKIKTTKMFLQTILYLMLLKKNFKSHPSMSKDFSLLKRKTKVNLKMRNQRTKKMRKKTSSIRDWTTD